jgi:hypothetical protein
MRNYLIAGGVILVVVFGGLWIAYRSINTVPEPQACTLEAKLCPDGSSVGRTGPNCEFAACPQVEGAATSTDTGKG